jgi:hypothetical protein
MEVRSLLLISLPSRLLMRSSQKIVLGIPLHPQSEIHKKG